ncbi:hypothetical protein EYC80_003867 [Monilinia laxa]|uniref:Uncharacterized protein n=1 Tax=Monilinia laxa TaxID=61186 RepID=A0A5N6KL24_MONLA|nr:hypothetical protein EYC80_003867 [Monilinia laxa]
MIQSEIWPLERPPTSQTAVLSGLFPIGKSSAYHYTWPSHEFIDSEDDIQSINWKSRSVTQRFWTFDVKSQISSSTTNYFLFPCFISLARTRLQDILFKTTISLFPEELYILLSIVINQADSAFYHSIFKLSTIIISFQNI